MKRAPGPAGPYPAPALPRPARLLVVAAYVLLAAAVCVDLASDPRLTFSPVLGTAPVLASIGTRRARVPLVTGAVALLLVVPLTLADPEVPVALHVTAAFTVLALTCISAANVVLVSTRERELLRSRSVASAAQQALLRPVPERVDGLRVAVRYLAAAADAQVGGDLYEVLTTPFGVRLLVGDVRGKGLGAVETAADVLGTFREAAQVEAELGAVARRLDATVRRRGVGEEFVTAALLTVPRSGETVELVNCGHLPPLVRRDGRVSAVGAGELDADPPLALRELAEGSYRPTAFAFGKGDLLLLYTDGATEARDAAGRFYPLERRLAALPDSAPGVLTDRLVADLLAYVGGELADDAALLAVRRE
ncbi:serine/threonine-protein phosphatase [Streptomyces mobaraensis NBRC 13819 = DSM 40847]|uniref:Protein serine/threonine phosphatase n=1 Tax=Streptomyces mobaraensis (strain ATCC 29032 / DSM 40847 / JCM 4168 / NBRC 13819 / NCIMB 11159 / IPCR 16-22) TaxID=1223523 RepID=M3C862_STRM1|nr:PP2C family protein-serine/threonine phosphatase [Streptomyces mobaraensis]EMF00161.1 protein serine/threonine phosphatase [Streptomyces mobaraensis NBRC 13819 = DSM 40847]QTT72492.1 serine/threonine-protein phosphatase [Streptomyces mobaraensis NBRC 13819 = DSM 40847]